MHVFATAWQHGWQSYINWSGKKIIRCFRRLLMQQEDGRIEADERKRKKERERKRERCAERRVRLIVVYDYVLDFRGQASSSVLPRFLSMVFLPRHFVCAAIYRGLLLYCNRTFWMHSAHAVVRAAARSLFSSRNRCAGQCCRDACSCSWRNLHREHQNGSCETLHIKLRPCDQNIYLYFYFTS